MSGPQPPVNIQQENILMKKLLTASIMPLALCYLTTAAFAATPNGKAAFDANCVACHPDGGNIVNPAKTLRKMTLQANGIKTAKDIVKTMRKPGPGMTVFDKKALSDTEATAIADYILKTFK
jgi:cytochrome c6